MVKEPVQTFYVLSLNERYNKCDYLAFWRPKAAGYASPLSWSGKWTRDEINGQAGYLNDGKLTLAVPTDAVDRIAVAPTPGTIDNDAGPVVLNTRKNRNALLRASAKAWKGASHAR